MNGTGREGEAGQRVQTVSADDVLVDRLSGRLVARGKVTTAHVAIARFYMALPRPARVPFVDRIAAAPSEFSIGGLLDDFRREARTADAKTRARVARAAHVRRCALRGVLPCCVLPEEAA
jgi:hypothetical protein